MKRFWQIGNILSLLFALVANTLVATRQLDVPSINTISDRYATLLTPANYAFAIWSLIYLLLVIFSIYQARDVLKPDDRNEVPQRIGPWFMIASLANGLWTYVFVQVWVGLSVIILLILTASLYVILKRLDIALFEAPRRTILFVWWPLLLYTGWVTIATVVTIASWFEFRGMELSPIVCSLVIIAVCGGLLWLLARRNVRELVLASAWGIAAISVRQSQLGQDVLVMLTAAFGAAVLIGAIAVHAYKNNAAKQLFGSQ
jgi:hypothetical protein